MRLQYAKTQKEDNFLLSGDEFRHSTKVLRQKKGDTIHVFDGSGSIFTCTIISIDKKHLTAKVISEEKKSPPAYQLSIALSPTKSPSRYEWFVEKAVEIGVSNIYPILTHRSERNKIKHERLERIIVSAMKQSLNIHQPTLHPFITFSDMLHKVVCKNKYIACLEEQTTSLSMHSFGQEILVAIGPEGGFTTTEIAEAKAQGYLPVSLGKSRLRTETAGIVACQIVKTVHEKNA